MGGKKEIYQYIFGSFTEPFNCFMSVYNISKKWQLLAEVCAAGCLILYCFCGCF